MYNKFAILCSRLYVYLLNKLNKKQKPMNQANSIIEMTLRAGCYSTEDMVYNRPIEGEEMRILESEFVQNCKRHAALQEQFKKVQEEFKNKMKPLEELKKEQLATMRQGTKEIEGTLYLFDDQDNKIMIYKDAEGNVILSRPLTPKERQLNFVSEAQKAV